MGKKGTWFSSAIKRLFTKQKKNHPLNNNENNKGKEKRFKHGSFIPLFREPSSIEHILGEFDQHNLLFTQHHPTTQSQPQPQPQPQPQSQPQSQSQAQPQPQPQSQPQPQPQPQSQAQPKPQPQPRPQSQPQPQPQSQAQPQPQPQPQSQAQPQPQTQSQTKPHAQPQLRPQPSSSSGRHVPPPPPRVVHQQPKISHRPESTLQRHLSATRIQAVYRGHMARRNIRGLTGLVRLQRVVTGQNVKRQTTNAMKQMQLLVRVQTQIRSQRVQMLKNQALKPQHNPHKQADEHWDDSFITKEERQARLQRKEDAVIKRERAMAYAYSHQLRKDTAHQTSLVSGYPSWWNWSQGHTPSPLKDHQFATTPTPGRTHTQPTTPMSSRSMTPSERLIKYSKARKGYPMKDDDSLMSCPPFSVPNYMSPTVSTRAKARAGSNPKERSAPSTPGSESSKRRFSFPFTLKSPGSIGDLSMNSVPASMGRKPFNRFV